MYIERAKAIKALTGWDTDPTDEDIEYVLTKEVPAADVVEVVRCRECKHYDTEFYDEKEKVCTFWAEHLGTEPDDFCSYGVRRDTDVH